MNLFWIVGIAMLVLVENLLPAGGRPGAVSGILFIGSGLWLLG